jgi:hypothetical protein
MLVEGGWWENEAREMFNNIAKEDSSRGFGKRDYRFLMTPAMEGQAFAANKTAVETAENGVIIVPKQKDKDKLTENQIQEKLQQYKLDLDNELMQLLAFERKNEELREETMKKLQTKKQRTEMEKEYGKERAEATSRIQKKNAEIKNKLEQYERQLRKENK